MIGAELGNFRILEELGQGGMGVVYKAIDTSLDRLVAVKALNAELSRNPELVERFRAEARAQANLNHTNIATLYAFLAQGGQAWMVMEYIEGENISQMLERRGLLPPDVAVPLFKQALLGVGWAHRMGIVHRDLKPSNLMVNKQGIVKVMDFGIAKVMGSGRGLTRTGTALGTAYYMSPEQVMNNAVDIRSDIYSLGVTLYEMLTANVPFQGASDFQIMTEHVNVPPPPPTRHYPYIPPGIENAVLKALSKEPAARFQTVEEFGAALEHPQDFGIAYGISAPIVPPPPAPPPAATTPPPVETAPRAATPPPLPRAPVTPPPVTGPAFTPPPLTGPAVTPPPIPSPVTAGLQPPPPPPQLPPPVAAAPGTPLLGTPQRKIIAGAAGLAVLAGIVLLSLPRHHDPVPEPPHGGSDTPVVPAPPHGEVTVWPPAPPPGSDSPAPVELKVVKFATDAARIAAGQKTRLYWSVQGASEITITPSVGVVNAEGSKDIAVERTTQFVLTARKLGGEEVHQTVTVEVGPAAPVTPRQLAVAFAAQPEEIASGQSTLLRWSVPGADLVTILPGIGRVPVAGSRQVKPAQTTTYRLQARAAKGVTGAGEVTVQVQQAKLPPAPPPPPAQVRPEISFDAVPNTIQPGGAAMLRWNLQNAAAATITPAPGVLRQASGQFSVSPATTTTYVLTARSKDGITETANVIVQVAAPPPPPPPAPGRTASAMIAVVHDHGGALNASVWPSCYGALQVTNGMLRYAVAGTLDGRQDGFEVPLSQVQDVKLNRLRIRNQPAFHILVRGQHYNFVATGMAATQAVSELEAATAKR